MKKRQAYRWRCARTGRFLSVRAAARRSGATMIREKVRKCYGGSLDAWE